MKIEIYDNNKKVFKKQMKGSTKISKELKKDLSERIIFFGIIHNLKGDKHMLSSAFINTKQDLING